MLWLIPLVVSLRSFDWKFIILWSAASSLFFYYMSLALYLGFRSRVTVIAPETPRKVYKFFKFCSNATFVAAFGGYLFILALVLLNVPVAELYEVGFTVIFYGLYFGVLGRDLIQLLSDAMAVSIGYHSPEGMPLRGLQASTCAICGGEVHGGGAEFFQLNCSHSFHNSCIRGWSILGKNETCPYCKERIDLTPFKENPWQQQEYLYGKFLDLVRYFVVWHPVIFLIGYCFSLNKEIK